MLVVGEKTLKIHQELKARTLIPFCTVDSKVDFEGSVEEWEKVKDELLPKINIE
jgi:hypothetical protein